MGHVSAVPGSTTITLPIDRYEKLRRDATEAQQLAESLRVELVAERAKTTEQRLTEVSDFVEAAKTVIDHATANLHPEHIRDMPAEAMATAAKYVGRIIGATQRDQERALVWAERAGLILSWRDKRKARGWGEDVETAIVPAKRRWWTWWRR